MIEDNQKQRLSLLLDGELELNPSLRLLADVEADSELQAQWRRYHLIGAALRSEVGVLPDSGFVDRISAAVAEEPTILAPSAIKPTRRGFREQAATLAIAASLAAVAVMVGKSLIDYSPARGPELLAKASLSGSDMQTPIDPEFRDYLVTHYETAYLSGAQGMLPSMRLVSSDARR